MASEFDQHNKKLDEARRTCGITRVAGVMVIYIKWNPGTIRYIHLPIVIVISLCSIKAYGSQYCSYKYER
jgi:hypothetical protein